MWDLVGFHLNSWFVWHGNHPIDKWCCEGCVCLETVSCFHWCLHVSLSSFPPFFLTFIVVCSFNRFFFRMIFLHELGLSSLNKIVINLSVIVVAMSMISFILQRHFTKIYQFLSHNPCLFSSIFFRLFDLLFHHFFFSTSSSFFFFFNNSWFVWHGNHPINKWCYQGCLCLNAVSCFHWCLSVSSSFLTFIAACSFNRNSCLGWFCCMNWVWVHKTRLSSTNASGQAGS